MQPARCKTHLFLICFAPGQPCHSCKRPPTKSPGGLFFARLASSIGIEDKIKLVKDRGERRYQLPDGSERFLVDEAMLVDVSATLEGEFIEPIKTTVVQNMRSMTTWCLRKNRHRVGGGG